MLKNFSNEAAVARCTVSKKQLKENCWQDRTCSYFMHSHWVLFQWEGYARFTYVKYKVLIFNRIRLMLDSHSFVVLFGNSWLIVLFRDLHSQSWMWLTFSVTDSFVCYLQLVIYFSITQRILFHTGIIYIVSCTICNAWSTSRSLNEYYVTLV